MRDHLGNDILQGDTVAVAQMTVGGHFAGLAIGTVIGVAEFAIQVRYNASDDRVITSGSNVVVCATPPKSLWTK